MLSLVLREVGGGKPPPSDRGLPSRDWVFTRRHLGTQICPSLRLNSCMGLAPAYNLK